MWSTGQREWIGTQQTCALQRHVQRRRGEQVSTKDSAELVPGKGRSGLGPLEGSGAVSILVTPLSLSLGREVGFCRAGCAEEAHLLAHGGMWQEWEGSVPIPTAVPGTHLAEEQGRVAEAWGQVWPSGICYWARNFWTS